MNTTYENSYTPKIYQRLTALIRRCINDNTLNDSLSLNDWFDHSPNGTWRALNVFNCWLS